MNPIPTFFIAFQVMCLVFASVATVFNIKKLRGQDWFWIYFIYGVGIWTMTFRRIQVLFIDPRPSAFTLETMVWQTIISLCFLICSSMAFGMLHGEAITTFLAKFFKKK